MSATAVLAELNAAGVVLEAADGQLRLTAERGTLTPNLLESVRSCKQDLLKIMKSPSLSAMGRSCLNPIFEQVAVFAEMSTVHRWRSARLDP